MNISTVHTYQGMVRCLPCGVKHSDSIFCISLLYPPRYPTRAVCAECGLPIDARGNPARPRGGAAPGQAHGRGLPGGTGGGTVNDTATTCPQRCRHPRCPAQARYRADVRDGGSGWLDLGVPLCPYHFQWVSNHGRLVAFEDLRAGAMRPRVAARKGRCDAMHT